MIKEKIGASLEADKSIFLSLVPCALSLFLFKGEINGHKNTIYRKNLALCAKNPARGKS